MFEQVWRFFIYGIGRCIELTRTFILDNTIAGNVTLFNFIMFGMFARIIIFILEYMKKIEITVGENEDEYKKEKRHKK